MSASARRALLGAILACSSVPALAVDFGRTQGSFGVSPTGAATYTIPIWTPPGPNGVTPSLSLSYSSQGGNGLAGVGWNLDAVFAIERCDRTKHQDASAAAVDLTMSDRFCFGGNRLRLGSGTYGAASSIYYTEIADFSRITAYGSAGNGPQYFIVEAKNGLKYEYGNTTSSRVLLGTTVLRWMLNKVYDRNGNNYVVSYNNTTGFAVPDVISWTPTYLGSPSYRYEAKFNYFSTRTDEDSYIGKVAGLDVANRHRLENVQIKSNGSVVRKYRFAYGTSSATSRSRLTSAKECADDTEANCFLPLTFDYQAGQTGVVTTAASGGSTGSSLYAGKYDFNGDGRSDLLYVTGSTWKVAFSTGSAVGTAVDTGISSSATILVQRFLANHQDGLLVNVSGFWSYVGYTGSTFVSTSTGIPVPTGYVSGGEPKATDNNGDGIADLVWTIGGSVMLRLNATTAGATVPTFGSAFTAASFSVGSGNVAITDAQKCPIERKCDVNGDGRADLIANVVSVTGCDANGCTITNTKYDFFASGTGYSAVPQVGAVGYTGINFNDDACIDRVPNFSAALQVAGCNNGSPISLTLPATPILVLDWNGDGKTDLLVNNGSFFGVYLSRGSTASPFSSLISTAVPVPAGCSSFVFDLDGDGFDDIGCVGTSSPFAVSYYTHNGGGGALLTQQPDLLSSATDGYGVNFSPSYVSTSQSNYTRGTGTELPLVDATDPIVVVGQVTSSNGIGGTYNKTYSYLGARTDAARGQSVGFQRLDETDSRNGLITRTYFEQAFPRSGMVSQTEVMQPNDTTTISRHVFTNTSTQLGTPPDTNNQRYFAYMSGSIATQYELGGTWDSVLLRTATTANTYETTGGTLYDQTVTTTEPASGAHGVNAGGTWVARTYLPLASLMNDAANWCLGRPGEIQQINSHNLTYPTTITRTTSVTWNASNCRPTQTVAEPGSATLELTTAIGYDGFGNVSSTAVTGVGVPTRTTSSIYTDGTFTTGQFPLSVTQTVSSTVSQTSTLAWNYDFGVPISATDANGITTSWWYDSFGRRNRENRPDDTYTDYGWSSCSGCDSRVRTFMEANDYAVGGGAPVTRTFVLTDQFDRAIYEYVSRNDAYFNRTTRNFDALGRIEREYFPVSSAGSDVGYVSTTYDLVNRPVSISRPISESNSTLQTTDLFYEGLKTSIRDAQGKFTYRIRNAADQLVRSQDHDLYYQDFDYDAFGNVKRVRDSASNDLQTSNYNIRGMLIDRTDLDMGKWVYDLNALGEALHVRDAKTTTPAWTQTFAYDLLGRLTSRTEAEGTSTWVWGVLGDNTPINKYVGLLKSVTGPGYSETYTYDSIGRPSSTKISADTDYYIDYAYNSFGLLDSLTYPTSTASYRLKLKYEYQNGRLFRISDFNIPANGFWIGVTANARGQYTQEFFGNGLQTNSVFDAVNGRVKSIQTGVGGGTGVQNLAYEWDLLGNLTKRQDLNQSTLTEEFSYDNLYRLDTSQRNTLENLNVDYNALGNITKKSDVGDYVYDASKKHQLISTTNGWTFGYDANGNMTSGRGATMTWTSFNYPLLISNGSDTASFSYTPDRQYWKQVSNYTSGGAATTVYVGGLLEKVTTTLGTDFRHMIRAGGATIIVSRLSSGTNTVKYVTSDHLGSSSAITDNSGGILVNSSFDAFGKRRGSNWSGSPSAGDWTAIASTTRRGFTEHTMLDNLSLTHMNGRVYDQVLGRFLSADPHITDPLNTQSFNRYSYVNNNPLSATDPSGFDTDSPPRIPGIPDPPDLPPCWAAGPAHGCQPADLPEPDDGGEVLPEIVVSAKRSHSDTAWSGVAKVPINWPYGRRVYRQGDLICDEDFVCLRPDGGFLFNERGLEPASWLDPLFMGAAYGLDKSGACTGDDCQLAVAVIAAVVTKSPVKAARGAGSASGLAKQLGSQEGVAELLAGGGKAIAGAGAKVPIRDVGRLVSQYGGRAEDWAKVTSTASGHVQTHAYRNIVTGEVVELKSILP